MNETKQYTKEERKILDILVKDKDWKVRESVAKQGYGLDILVTDKDCDVRMIAKKKLEEAK